MRPPDGFIEVIEVGEIFFDVLRALIASIQSILSSLLQVSSYLKSYLSADVITTNRSLYKSWMSLHIPPLFSVDVSALINNI